MAPIRSGLGDKKKTDYEGAMNDWLCFVNETKNDYGVDMSVLTKPFSEEQKKYYLQVWQILVAALSFYFCGSINDHQLLYFFISIHTIISRRLGLF